MTWNLPVLPPVSLLVFAFLAALANIWRRSLTYPISLTGTGVSLFTALAGLVYVLQHGPLSYHLGGWPPPIGIEYVLDYLSAFMVTLITFIGFLGTIYSYHSLNQEAPGKASFAWPILLLMLAGLTGIIMTGDLFNLYVFLEIASLSAYALIAIGGDHAALASFRYLILGTLGACFYLLGVGFLYFSTGSLNMADVSRLLPSLYGSKAVVAALTFIIIGLSIKVALFPLHFWLPEAYTQAPSAISAILAAIFTKTMAYAMIRIIFAVFTPEIIEKFLVLKMLAWAAALAMLSGDILAIAQNDLKKILAYSSVANIGYIMLGVGLSTSTTLGLTPALMHILNHALMKACMFFAAGAFVYKANLQDIREFQGLIRKMPYSSLAFILATLSMIGVPPSVGFVTKWYLIVAALEAKQFVFVGVIFVSTLLVIFYLYRVVESMLKPGEEVREVENNELPLSMLIPLLILGSLCFIVGIIWLTEIPLPLMKMINLTFGLGTP